MSRTDWATVATRGTDITWRDCPKFCVKEHRDTECRSISIVDDAWDSYEIWAAPDVERQGIATLGVSLSKRGSKRHHALHRERQRFTFEQSVPISELTVGLNACWGRVHEWIAEAGHTSRLWYWPGSTGE